MKEFGSFLEDIKQNRESEIRVVISKGYSCNPKTYKFFDYFTIEWFDQRFQMSLFANNSETNFLIVEDSLDEDSSVIKKRTRYYSMVELFDGILSRDIDNAFVNAITSASRNSIRILYHRNVYSVEVPFINKRTFKKIGNRDRSLLYLFILFFLIQNKSNRIFKNNEEYVDGIYRFYKVYSTVKTDVVPMNRRGWFISNGKFEYKRYLEMRVIRLIYDGKMMLKEENLFSKQLKSSLSNEEALLLFLNEYNRINGANITKEDALNDEKLFFVRSDTLLPKEIGSCDSIKPFNGSNNDRCFRLKGVSIRINTVAHYFMISKFNKKYYLTQSELDEIIGVDPSESSINDRSEGSNSL